MKSLSSLLLTTVLVVLSICSAHAATVFEIEMGSSTFSYGPWYCESDCNAGQENQIWGTFQVVVEDGGIYGDLLRFVPIEIFTSALAEGAFKFPTYKVSLVSPNFSGDGNPCNFFDSPGTCWSTGNFGYYSGIIEPSLLQMYGAAPVDMMNSYHFQITASLSALPLDVDCNGDGLRDSQAISLGLSPCDADEDTDNDGISDVEELAGDIYNPFDSDGDGLSDAIEMAGYSSNPGALSIFIHNGLARCMGLKMESEVWVKIESTRGGVLKANSAQCLQPLLCSNDIISEDAPHEYPYGMYDYTFEPHEVGEQLKILYGDTAHLPEGAVLRAATQRGGFFTIDTANISHTSRSIVYAIADNGDFDLDNEVGKIRSIVGLSSVPTSQQNDNGGSVGCFLDAVSITIPVSMGNTE